jgi:hypothetical protein
MAINVTLGQTSTLNNQSILTQNNANSATIQTALVDALSRSGGLPNNMNSALDMNSNPIINVPFASLPNEPVVLAQITGTNLPLGFPTLVGDVTGTVNTSTGQVPTTVVKVDGVSYPANPSTNTVPVVTSSNTITYEAVPGSAIATNTVTNTNLAQMSAHTYKGNNTGSTTNSIDVTNTQLTADLNQFTPTLQGLVPGSGGGTANFLRADGTWTSPGSLPAPTVQRFTTGTSQTYTPTGGTIRVKVRMVGGGGGGGAGITNAGAAGTDTSFGSWTAIHGNGGGAGAGGSFIAGGSGGTGGVNGTGTLIARFSGASGFGSVNSAGSAVSGAGGATPFGGGGAVAVENGTSVAGGVGQANTGSGGGGAASSGNGIGGGGGAGEYVEFQVTSIGATTYTVGTGGNGGAAGGAAGGNGAAGIIIIEEFAY